MDELNHDFQALALEGRAMGEVSELVCQKMGEYFLREGWSCLSSDVSRSSLRSMCLLFLVAILMIRVGYWRIFPLLCIIGVLA